MDLSDLGQPRDGVGGPSPPVPGRSRGKLDLSDLGRPRGPGESPENPLQERGVTLPERIKLGNVAPSDRSAVEWLKRRGYDAALNSKGQIAVKKPGEKWKVTDPEGPDWMDIPDIGDEVVSGILSGLGMAGGATLAAPSGPGMLAGAAAGGALGSAAAESGRRGLGEIAGFRDTPEEFLQGVGVESIGGAAAPLVFAGGAKAIKTAAPLVRNLLRTPGQGVKGAAGAVKGGVKATPKAIVEAGKSAGKTALNIPVAGPFVRTIGQGMKKGWREALGKEENRFAPEVKAAVTEGFSEKKLPSEIFKDANLTPEILAARPAIQETAAKVVRGEPISDFEESILGRAIDIARGNKADLTPGEKYLEHLYWLEGAKGKNPQMGERFRVEYARRTGKGERVGDRPGDIIERSVRLRPNFMTREEVRANAKDLSDEQLRQILRDEWGVQGGKPALALDKVTSFLNPVAVTQKGNLGSRRGPFQPLEQLGRGDLEELLYRVQPEVITVGKGGAYDPKKYQLTRFIDTMKAEPFGGLSKSEMVEKMFQKYGVPRKRAQAMSRLVLRNILFGPRARQMGHFAPRNPKGGKALQPPGAWISSGLPEVTAVKIPTFLEGPTGPRTYRRFTKEDLEELGKQMFGS